MATGAQLNHRRLDYTPAPTHPVSLPPWMEPRTGQSHCSSATRALVRGLPAEHGHLTGPLSPCLGPASAHSKGSGILAQPLSSPADLREGWVSPRTPQTCLKTNRTSVEASNLTRSHLEAPGLILRYRTTATSGFLELAACQPRTSQIANHRAVAGSSCLCGLFFPKTQPQTAFGPQVSTAGREGAAWQWDGTCGRPTRQSQPKRNPDPLDSLGTTYLLLLIPIPFSHLP